ncbi:MAG: glycosyltransferase [Nitrososphaeria archaeon]
MKVLHLGKFCPPTVGGMEVFTYDLLEYLNSKNIKADLLCFNKESKKGNIFRNFTFHSCRTNLILRSAPLSIDFVKTFKDIEKDYDIIHVHSPNPLAEILAIFSTKRVIIHWHNDIVRQKILYKFYKPIQQRVLNKAEKVICTSPNYLETSVQLKNFKDKAVIIPLGVNYKRLERWSENKEIISVLDKYSSKKIVLAMGRLVEYKGFEYLIEAGKYLDDSFVILIAGGGPLYNKLKRKNLKDRVILLGKVNNITPLLKRCDIFCLPSISRNESFGLVLVEALYFGKPLVTTAVDGSGMNYVNQNGITGFVVPPKDPFAIADAIKKICFDRKLYLKFSENAKERFKEFDIKTIGEKIIKLYSEVLNDN